MKDKKTLPPTVPTNLIPQAPGNSEQIQPMNVDIVERITDEDKNALEVSKVKVQTALTDAKLALSQNELMQANHQNLILTLALRYGLVVGDQIGDDGVISRVNKQGKV
jgi:hypothetical protein